ncbi:MAG: general secretion pathway protein GspB [Candidatus Omnitrophota bacterium]|nr:general secretion pathway protein GspB [Candidatus Omnitrophota bacterium]
MQIFLILFILFNMLISIGFCQDNELKTRELKRDPFVKLIDPTGRIKTEAELIRPAEVILPLNIILKGIIWDKQKPLVIINDKVYKEGAVIFEGLILEKINPDNIILNDRGQKVKINLRKKEKK